MWKTISTTNKTLKYKPIDLSLKNKQIVFCPDLSLGILSFSSYVNVEAINNISFYEEMNEYKLLCTKSKKLVNALKQLEMSYILGFLNN